MTGDVPAGGPPGSPPLPDPLPEQLVPVAASLIDQAERDARSIRDESERLARTVAAGAAEQANAILARAARDGRAAAASAGAGSLADAQRRARQSVLAARRAAYERLRSGAIAGVEEQLDSPAGRDLRRFLVAVVGRAVGGTGSEGRDAGGRWRAVADGPAGRASIGVEKLVDQALHTFAGEIPQLWT